MKREHTSRRRFLKSTVLGAASAAAGLASAESPPERKPDPARERLERLAERYGSELGCLRKAGR